MSLPPSLCVVLAASVPAFIALACSSAAPPGEPVAQAVAHLEAQNLPYDADLAQPPEATIFFDPGWQENVQGTIYGGATVGLVASPDRFPSCGVGGVLTAFVRIDGAEALALPMSESQGGWPRATVQLPASAKRIETWLHAQDGDCSEWDSDLGKNYVFAAHAWQPTIVHFRSDWSEQADAALASGGVLVVDYDLNRLTECRATDQYGLPVWDIVGHVRFDTGDQLDHSVTYPVQSVGVTRDRERGLTLFPIPEQAARAEVWFENTQLPQPFPTAGACPAWDSNLNQNYSFPLVGGDSSRAGWAGDVDYVQYHRDPARHFGDVDPVWYFDTMAGAELAAWVEVQVYVPGLTDQPYAGQAQAAQAAGKLSAQAVTDALAGDVDGWGTTDLAFARQQGNNFVYTFPFWQLRYSIYQQPVVAPGLYQYYFRFSADNGATWLDAGKADGHARRFVVGPQMDCSMFPDRAPDGCPQKVGVGWAGSWGGLFTHACERRDGLADPVVFTKSAAGHDCMALTAEVWVPGLTDADADPATLRAEVVTDLGFEPGGPLSAPVSWPLVFDGRTGNNYRFRWDLGEHVGRADRGDYHYRFRFSADAGQTWYQLGKGDGPDGGADRALWIRNDSLDVAAQQTCENLESWQGPSTYYATCVDYEVAADYDASSCEFYVNAFGRGSFSHNGASAAWIEAYLRVGPQQGELLNAGMLTRYDDAGTQRMRYSMGVEIEPGYYETGFTYQQNQMGSGVFEASVQDVAFFVDVRRPDSNVVRLWWSNQGANFTLSDVFAVPGTVQGGGSTSIEYASDSAALFAQKHACQ